MAAKLTALSSALLASVLGVTSSARACPDCSVGRAARAAFVADPHWMAYALALLAPLAFVGLLALVLPHLWLRDAAKRAGWAERGRP